VVLDIGAFKGEYAFLARNTNPKVLIYAFEANPISAKSLSVACEQRDIRLIECAVVEHESRISFILAEAQSRIMVEMTALSNQEVVEVAGITLDSWTTENEITPSLIKIDTEGAEAGILRGGSSMIKEVKPIILCEILSDEAGQDVMKALPPSYRYYHIDENSGSVTLMSTITRKKWRNLNWLFIPVIKESKLIPILGS
jgi:FkbM family methyltransferase